MFFGRSAGRSSAQTANDASSETAEGGSGLAQPVPNGGAQQSRPESESAPDAEAQAVTDRSRPERFSAAPLLGVFSLRRGCKNESETYGLGELDITSESHLSSQHECWLETRREALCACLCILPSVVHPTR